MANVGKNDKRPSPEGSQSPISHSICGILGLTSQTSIEVLAESERPQAIDQVQLPQTTEDNLESILQKQGKITNFH